MTIRAVAEPSEAEAVLSRVAYICETEHAGDPEPLISELVSDLIACDHLQYERLPDAAAAPGRVWIRVHRDLSSDLCLLTRRGGGARGWILVRNQRRFTAADIERGREILPLLIALDRELRVPSPGVRLVGARSLDNPPGPSPAAPVLTARELAVLALIADGLTATAAARRLAVAPSTVRKHLEHAYAKLGHHDRLAAVVHARGLGLI